MVKYRTIQKVCHWREAGTVYFPLFTEIREYIHPLQTKLFRRGSAGTCRSAFLRDFKLVLTDISKKINMLCILTLKKRKYYTGVD